MHHKLLIRQAKKEGKQLEFNVTSTSHEIFDSLSYGICDKSNSECQQKFGGFITIRFNNFGDKVRM